MRLKGAQQLLEELVHHVAGPRGCAISLTERIPKDAEDTNWRAGADLMPPKALERYDGAIAELRRQYPRIDWSGITEKNGEFRRIARWFSEVAA